MVRSATGLFKQISSAGRIALVLTTFVVSGALANPAIEFGEIIIGFNLQYHEQPAGSFRQDLSGAATDGRHIIFVDDGGSPSDFNFVRVMTALPDEQAENLALFENHKDLEAATFHNGRFVISTSLSSAADPDQQRLTRFRLNESGDQLLFEKSVLLRDELMAALEEEFGEEWFDRIRDEDPRSGGLNIEGLTRPRSRNDVLWWGLRSPLFGDTFGNPDTDPDLSLSDGLAIVAKVRNPFDDDPRFDFQTLHLPTDLGDHGIRGIEWIPKLKGYVVIGGPIPAADDYSLWWLSTAGKLVRLDDELLDAELEEAFRGLCRPESVIQLSEDGKDYLVILSEESGAACDAVSYNFIMVEIVS